MAWSFESRKFRSTSVIFYKFFELNALMRFSHVSSLSLKVKFLLSFLFLDFSLTLVLRHHRRLRSLHLVTMTTMNAQSVSECRTWPPEVAGFVSKTTDHARILTRQDSLSSAVKYKHSIAIRMGNIFVMNIHNSNKHWTFFFFFTVFTKFSLYFIIFCIFVSL